MGSLTKYLSLALAVCFACAAVYLTGKLLALGRLDLLWYLTFSDFVNYAPATLLGWGILFAWFVGNDAYIGHTNRLVAQSGSRPLQKRHTLGLLVILVIMLAVLFAVVPWKIILPLLPVPIFMFVASVAGRKPLTSAFGEIAANIFESFVTLVSMAFVVGYITGAVSDTQPIYTVHVGNAVKTSNVLMPMDRGLVIIRTNGFELVPWSEVHSVGIAPSPPLTPATKAPMRPAPIVKTTAKLKAPTP